MISCLNPHGCTCIWALIPIWAKLCGMAHLRTGSQYAYRMPVYVWDNPYAYGQILVWDRELGFNGRSCGAYLNNL